MQSNQEITSIGFKPPHDARLLVEALSIDELRQRAPAAHFEKLQRADFYRLIGVLTGSTQPMVDFFTFSAQAGHWLLVRPGQVFRYDFSQPWSGWLLVFRPDGLSLPDHPRAPDEFDLLRRVEDLQCLHTPNSAQHHWLMRSMQQLQQDGSLTADVALRNGLLRHQLASTLLRLWMWQSSNPVVAQINAAAQANFRRFRQRLEADFATQHQVQHYAKALGMSEKTLSRACMAAAGIPAKAVINQRLLLESRRLLAHTTLAVQAISRELGFEESTNFVKFFRKEAQMTPLAFRQHQSGETPAQAPPPRGVARMDEPESSA